MPEAGRPATRPGSGGDGGVHPLPAPEEKHGYVRAMFDAIAPKYDLLNAVLSAQLHHGWRRFAATQAALKPGDAALDICTGTGDFAFELARRVGATGRVIGADFSAPMVAYGEEKRRKRPLPQVRMMLADAQNLPFPDNSFDAVTVGFGIRNVADRPRGFAEMARVTRPGGRVVVLEFNQPPNRAFAALYHWYSFRVLPVIGGVISGKRAAYEYLPSSVAAFPSRDELADELRAVGLTDVRYHDLMLGIAVVHCGTKPPEQENRKP
jgi:demethylmenaquinone methyltransferase / 2-methoxy-6-polyprenyl-1,4-benzoquinol methylase